MINALKSDETRESFSSVFKDENLFLVSSVSPSPFEVNTEMIVASDSRGYDEFVPACFRWKWNSRQMKDKCGGPI